MKIKKILNPIDGSEHSLRSTRYAIKFAKLLDADIILLHCHARFPIVLSEPYFQQAVNEINKISEDANIEIWVPIYPKIPFHDAEYTYDILLKFYTFFTESFIDGEVILMGDSAGGGLTLGMAQKIRELVQENSPVCW